MNEYVQFILPIVNIVSVLVGIGIVYGATTERLKKIESEISKFRDFLINTARLEERLMSWQNIVIAQGKRIDRLEEDKG